MGTVAPEGTPWQVLVDRIGAELSERSGGRVRYKTYWGGRKGDESTLVRKCLDGKLDGIGVSTAALSEVLPAIEILELPFLFESRDEVDYVLDGFLYQRVRQLLAERGFVLHIWVENGWQNLAFADRRIEAPQDLVGARVRSQPAAMHLLAWKTFGATPVSMPVTGVGEALARGRVVGTQQTLLFLFASGWFNHLKHVTLSRHIYQPALIAYCRKFYDAQPPHIQRLLLADRAQMTAFGRRVVRAIEPELVSNLERSGVAIHRLDDSARRAFEVVARRIRAKFLRSASPDALRLLNAIVQGKKDFRRHAKARVDVQ